jgi:hypothetical protein
VLPTIPIRSTVLAAAALVLAVVVVAYLLRRAGHRRSASMATTVATVLGLGWSAQGMYDTATTKYEQAPEVAAVLFVVFEVWIVSRMLRAHQFRADRRRRGKFVRAVWIGACLMALVVALGEGWAQAPGRLAIPLLVALAWYDDLTAGDDPAERPPTSLRLTPRRVGLALGILEPGERDIRTVDRDRLRDRMTKLGFRQRYGWLWIAQLTGRRRRLAWLASQATTEDLREVTDRLSRSIAVYRSLDEWDLIGDEPAVVAGFARPIGPMLAAIPPQPAPEVHPVPEPQPEPEIVQPERPAPPAPDRETEREMAREIYRKSVRAGKPFSQRALAVAVDKSQPWARDRIAEVLAESNGHAPEPTPVP